MAEEVNAGRFFLYDDTCLRLSWGSKKRASPGVGDFERKRRVGDWIGKPRSRWSLPFREQLKDAKLAVLAGYSGMNVAKDDGI
jgi:hypothetical protein